MTETESETSSEVWISEGDAWFPNAAALCSRLGAAYIANVEGALYVGLPGKGEVTLAEALKEEGRKGRSSNVVAVK